MGLHFGLSGSPDTFMVMFVAMVLVGSSLPFWDSYPLR
jgi:hypothetical protein